MFGVIRKFGDDRGPSLAGLLAYYGFLSLFPLLLVFTTILGFIGNDRVADSILGSTLEQFPVVGEQIGKDAVHPIQGNGFALFVGIVLLLYGALGVTQVAQRIMADVWNVPNVVRPGFLPRLGRGAAFLAVLAASIAVTATVAWWSHGAGTSWLARVCSTAAIAAVNVVAYGSLFRALTPRQIPWRDLWPGAVAGGIGYTILLSIGTALVRHQLRHAEALYGQFGFVLGLMGWLFLVAQITIYAAEINVVWARRLWPRSLLQPPLTPADEAVLGAIAKQEERRPEQSVDVQFEDGPTPVETT